MIEREIDRPSPIPSCLLETNGLEKPSGYILADSGSDVSDCNLDHSIAYHPCRQSDFALFLICHRFKRIANEIDQDLLDLDPIYKCVSGSSV